MAEPHRKLCADVLGVLKVQAYRLDFNYLAQWVETLNLADLMAQALQEAGIDQISPLL